MRSTFVRVGLIGVAALLLMAVQSNNPRYFTLTGDGQLTLPKPAEYRNWVMVGTSMVPNDRNRGKAIFPGIHTVYLDPIANRFRQEQGAFPDGTVLVMENFHTGMREAESGFGHFTNGGQDLLIQIKDRRRFPGSGWKYFLFRDQDIKNGVKQAAPQEDGRCLACHAASAADDQVFVQYYPALGKPEYLTNPK